mgnify:CR=1 FL=1
MMLILKPSLTLARRHLRAPAPAASADDGAGDAHVLMQLGVPELERLLHKLDAVQGQLDAVQGS